MSYEFFKKLPTPLEIKTMYPVSDEVAKQKELNDAEIRKVFTGELDKFLLIIGPCSADNQEAVEDYVSRLAKIQEEVKDKLLIIPRVYTNKPRTTGKGYKGMLHQPDPEKKPEEEKKVTYYDFSTPPLGMVAEEPAQYGAKKDDGE